MDLSLRERFLAYGFNFSSIFYGSEIFASQKKPSSASKRKSFQNAKTLEMEGRNEISSEEATTVTVTAFGGNIETNVKALERVSYFKPQLSGRWNQGDKLSCDIDRANLYPCIAYAESGFNSLTLLLTKLPTTGDAADVVKTMHFLCLDVPTISTRDELVELEKSLKDTKSETMVKVARKTFDRSYEIPDRNGARDAATKHCFSIIQNILDLSDSKTLQKVVNDVLYVVSHAKTFGPRLRRHVWNTFDRRVAITPKQRNSLFSRWVTESGLSFDANKDSDDEQSGTDGDCTTGSIHQEEWLGDY